MQNTDNNNEQTYNYDELDLREIIYAILSRKKIIFIITFIFALSSLLYAYIAPIKWQSSALLIPADSSVNALPAQSSGLASMAGINLSKGSNDNGPKIMATIKSRDFFKHLIQFEGVLENLMALEAYDPNSGVSKFDDLLFDADKKTWKEGKKPSLFQSYIVYSSILSVTSPKLSSFIYLNVQHASPVFAKDFLELIIKEINELTRQRDLEKSDQSLIFLYNQLESVQQSDVQIAVSNLIEVQLKKQMMAQVSSNYALEVIDSPFIPELRISPKRKNILIIGTLLGFFVSLITVLTQHFTKKYFKKH